MTTGIGMLLGKVMNRFNIKNFHAQARLLDGVVAQDVPVQGTSYRIAVGIAREVWKNGQQVL